MWDYHFYMGNCISLLFHFSMWNSFEFKMIYNKFSLLTQKINKLIFILYYDGKWYIHNIFITLLKQILTGRLLIVVIGGQKSNLNCETQIRNNNNLPHINCYENVMDQALLYYDSFTLMKLNTSKITNFIQPRPRLWRLVTTNLILVRCHSRIENVQYSYKQYIRILSKAL